ncbi:hypothetical protein CF319_g3669 [Tilletia indica]|uniref:Uncharacterized protein n=1 Tax=Tilletia indica TaxID=43049 RepID=A0A177TWM7_9BASI|nr:hypothetical protein CF327_g3055 [Tilletia walkeri]KAE8223280.1 hypothetical protein CF319_g3669 [Tilletia indica]KAE8233718.1 hypothetical protein CF326_g1243 [Tilletia indica]KAE8260914.1 hypothetical protein A4X13_0g29 [Tilletia indica]
MASYIKKSLPTNEQGRVDFTPRAHHGWTGFVMLLGFLLPPLAVAARFGIGSDFFINCLCTICGYFPGHGHNFFIQNIRNNENKKRTPKWAKKLGLIDDSEERRVARNRQWASRYAERSANRVFYDEEGNAHTEQDPRAARPRRQRPGAERYLGNPEDEINGRGKKGGKRNKKNASSSSVSRVSSRSSAGGPLDPRDPYAAERRAAEREAQRSPSDSSVYLPSTGANDHQWAPEPPAKKSWFKKSKSAKPDYTNGGGDFVRPPASASASRDFIDEPFDERDPYAAERRAAQRGDAYNPRDSERRRDGAGANGRSGGRQLGDEFLN